MYTDSAKLRRAGMTRRARRSSLIAWFVHTSLALVILAILLCDSPPAGASILVAPARFEVEVGAAGATQTLIIVNRGTESIAGFAYAGGAAQRPDGSIEYLDDEVSRRAASDFVTFEYQELLILPGSHAAIPVHFRPLGNRTSFYPVIFVELVTAGTESSPRAANPGAGNPVQTVARIAVPVLMTNSLMRPHQLFHPVISDLDVRAVRGGADLEIALFVQNDGNVHGEIAGELAIFDPANRLIATLPVTAGRVLPGASRVVTVTWPAPWAQGAVRILASLGPEGSARAAAREASRTIDVTWDFSGDAARILVTEAPGLGGIGRDQASLSGLVLSRPEGE